MAARFTGTSVGPRRGIDEGSARRPERTPVGPAQRDRRELRVGYATGADGGQKKCHQETGRPTQNVHVRDAVRHRRRLSDLGGEGCAW